MYSILDFAKVGKVTLEGGTATVSGFPNYDTDKIHNPNVPILVLNLQISNAGSNSVHSGFANYDKTAGTDDWVLGNVKFTSAANGQITVTVA